MTIRFLTRTLLITLTLAFGRLSAQTTFTTSYQADTILQPSSITATPDGGTVVAALYRSADSAGNRDSMLLRSENGAAAFESAVLGRWHISTCPMSTPALGEGPGHTLLAMWETQGQIYRRTFDASGLSAGRAAISTGGETGDQKHPAFAWSRPKADRLLVAWVEGSGWAKAGQLAWECIDTRSGAKTLGRRDGVPAWSLPAVVPDADGGFTIIY